MTVSISKDIDGTYLAVDDNVYTHGIGSSAAEALNDLLDAMHGMYIESLADEPRLAPHLQRELDYLRTLFDA